MNWHPMACKNIYEYGECRDNKCKLLHQNTCNAYCKQGQCLRKNCWFIHPYHPPRIRQKETRDGLPYENNMHRYDRHNGNNHFSGSIRTYSSQSYVQPNMYYNHNKNERNYRDSEFFHRDWPTPMEEEILRKLREVIQMESNNCEPARW